MAGDQQAALIGQACFEPGMAKSTYGSGCFVIANTGAERRHSRSRLLATVGYRIDGRTTYALEGSIFNAGVAIKWLRDKLGLIESAADTEAAARRTGGDTGGVVVVPAFTGLGAPHWRPEARGLVTGLTLSAGPDEIVTATLQSIALQTVDLLAALRDDGVAATELRIDGGMAVNDWFCQYLADVAGVPASRPANTETTAVGAALLAAVGAGWHGTVEEAARAWRAQAPPDTFSPQMSPSARDDRLAAWRNALQRAL